jgi:phosphoinositide-3-kinase regulatory subunit 4
MAANLLGELDVRCIVYPMVKPYLLNDIPCISEQLLLDNLRPPISRYLYEETVKFALQEAAGDNRISINR